MVTIRAATEADRPAFVNLLARAFTEDPCMLHVLQSPPDEAIKIERLGHIFAAMASLGALAAGTVDLAFDGDKLLGAAIWEAPGTPLPSLWTEIQLAPVFYRAFGGVWGLVRGSQLHGKMTAHRPKEPHWYLHAIGVSEAARGKGVGGHLLEHRTDMADEAGVLAYLERSTEDSGRLYRRHGFVDQFGIDIGSETAVPWAMLRQPRS